MDYKSLKILSFIFLAVQLPDSNSFIDTSVLNIKETVEDQKWYWVFLEELISVAALLLHKAIGENLHCIFVDNGLLRKMNFLMF